MSRRPKSQSSISLFPFLAVLVCTMGALILLLIAMTQKMHRNAVARAAAERAAAAGLSVPTDSAVPAPPPPLLLPDDLPPPPAPPSGPSPEELRELALQRQRDREARRRELEEARTRAVQQLEQQWAATVAEARRRHAAEAEAARRVAADRDALLRSVQTLAQTKGGAVKNLAALSEREAELQQTSAVLEQNAAELARTAQQLRHEIEQAKRRQATGPSPLALVPYDGTSGTVRRPIYIECTDVGLRFLPEGETITAADLQGFNEGFNPLLAGTVALIRYWKVQNEASGGTEPEPYVLLLVRPSGSVAYYIARKLLTRLEVPFGYELIAEDCNLDIPDPDPNARKIVKTAVADALTTRDELIDALATSGGGRRNSGPGGSGPLPGGDFTEVDPFPASSRPGTAPQRSIRAIPTGEAANPNSLPSQPDELPLGPTPGGGTGSGGPRLTITPGKSPGNGLASSGTKRNGATPGATGPLAGGTGPKGGTGFDGRGPGTLPGNAGSSSAGEFADIGLGSGRDTGSSSPRRLPRGLAPDGGSELAALPGPGEDEDWRKGGAPGTEPGGPLSGSDDLTTPDEQPAATGGQAGPRSGSGPARAAAASRDAAGGTSGTSSASSAAGQPAPGADSNVSFSRQFGPKPEEYDPSSRASQSYGGSDDGPKSSTSQGESIKKRWGMTNGRATIGLEKKLEIHCLPNKILVGPNDATITCDGSETKEQLVRDTLGAIEQISLGWGKPPRNFYWIPVVKFVVYPGGNQHYERLQNGLREWGLFSSVEYTVREAPRKSFSGALK